jgi:hypothetical protein
MSVRYGIVRCAISVDAVRACAQANARLATATLKTQHGTKD